MQLFPRNSCKTLVSRSGFTRRSGLVRPASKSCRFSHHPLRVPKGWHRDFAACGQRSGLLAHTSAAFLKNCCTEKLFISPSACILQSSLKIYVSHETIVLPKHRPNSMHQCTQPQSAQCRQQHCHSRPLPAMRFFSDGQASGRARKMKQHQQQHTDCRLHRPAICL